MVGTRLRRLAHPTYVHIRSYQNTVIAPHGRASCYRYAPQPRSAPRMSAAPAPQPRSFWIPVICGAVILTIGVGARQSFGIFQKPIAADLKVGRELWSFANAIAMLLMGALSPFVGNIADRFGTARTVAAGGVLYVIGMFLIRAAHEAVLVTCRQFL